MVEMAKTATGIDRKWRTDPWRYLRKWCSRMLRAGRHQPRQLRISESVSLGDRRFIAVLEFADARYLVGGTSSSLVLLAQLEKGSVPALAAHGTELVPKPATVEEQH